ncbi:MAG TPA: hemerythrin domain-containing protein [Gemmataceae bacterium]|nr:hemerythrin domain-containing protein [Pirellulales bacterium]HZZ77592.1 hemerythrin domain-containing protein [Gemmataceae bacterium]
MAKQDDLAFATAFQVEHREMGNLLQRVRHATADGCDWSHDAAREARTAIEALERRLRQHFAQEEEGGYLEQALAAAPRLSRPAAELLRQHPAMLAQASTALSTAREAVSDSTRWSVLKQQVEELMSALVGDERSESAIVQEAFNTGFEH